MIDHFLNDESNDGPIWSGQMVLIGLRRLLFYEFYQKISPKIIEKLENAHQLMTKDEVFWILVNLELGDDCKFMYDNNAKSLLSSMEHLLTSPTGFKYFNIDANLFLTSPLDKYTDSEAVVMLKQQWLVHLVLHTIKETSDTPHLYEILKFGALSFANMLAEKLTTPENVVIQKSEFLKYCDEICDIDKNEGFVEEQHIHYEQLFIGLENSSIDEVTNRIRMFFSLFNSSFLFPYLRQTIQRFENHMKEKSFFVSLASIHYTLVKRMQKFQKNDTYFLLKTGQFRMENYGPRFIQLDERFLFQKQMYNDSVYMNDIAGIPMNERPEVRDSSEIELTSRSDIPAHETMQVKEIECKDIVKYAKHFYAPSLSLDGKPCLPARNAFFHLYRMLEQDLDIFRRILPDNVQDLKDYLKKGEKIFQNKKFMYAIDFNVLMEYVEEGRETLSKFINPKISKKYTPTRAKTSFNEEDVIKLFVTEADAKNSYSFKSWLIIMLGSVKKNKINLQTAIQTADTARFYWFLTEFPTYAKFLHNQKACSSFLATEIPGYTGCTATLLNSPYSNVQYDTCYKVEIPLCIAEYWVSKIDNETDAYLLLDKVYPKYSCALSGSKMTISIETRLNKLRSLATRWKKIYNDKMPSDKEYMWNKAMIREVARIVYIDELLYPLDVKEFLKLVDESKKELLKKADFDSITKKVSTEESDDLKKFMSYAKIIRNSSLSYKMLNMKCSFDVLKNHLKLEKPFESLVRSDWIRYIAKRLAELMIEEWKIELTDEQKPIVEYIASFELDKIARKNDSVDIIWMNVSEIDKIIKDAIKNMGNAPVYMQIQKGIQLKYVLFIENAHFPALSLANAKCLQDKNTTELLLKLQLRTGHVVEQLVKDDQIGLFRDMRVSKFTASFAPVLRSFTSDQKNKLYFSEDVRFFCDALHVRYNTGPDVAKYKFPTDTDSIFHMISSRQLDQVLKMEFGDRKICVKEISMPSEYIGRDVLPIASPRNILCISCFSAFRQIYQFLLLELRVFGRLQDDFAVDLNGFMKEVEKVLCPEVKEMFCVPIVKVEQLFRYAIELFTPHMDKMPSKSIVSNRVYSNNSSTEMTNLYVKASILSIKRKITVDSVCVAKAKLSGTTLRVELDQYVMEALCTKYPNFALLCHTQKQCSYAVGLSGSCYLGLMKTIPDGYVRCLALSETMVKEAGDEELQALLKLKPHHPEKASTAPEDTACDAEEPDNCEEACCSSKPNIKKLRKDKKEAAKKPTKIVTGKGTSRSFLMKMFKMEKNEELDDVQEEVEVDDEEDEEENEENEVKLTKNQKKKLKKRNREMAPEAVEEKPVPEPEEVTKVPRIAEIPIILNDPVESAKPEVHRKTAKVVEKIEDNRMWNNMILMKSLKSLLPEKIYKRVSLHIPQKFQNPHKFFTWNEVYQILVKIDWQQYYNVDFDKLVDDIQTIRSIPGSASFFDFAGIFDFYVPFDEKSCDLKQNWLRNIPIGNCIERKRDTYMVELIAKFELDRVARGLECVELMEIDRKKVEMVCEIVRNRREIRRNMKTNTENQFVEEHREQFTKIKDDKKLVETLAMFAFNNEDYHTIHWFKQHLQHELEENSRGLCIDHVLYDVHLARQIVADFVELDETGLTRKWEKEEMKDVPMVRCIKLKEKIVFTSEVRYSLEVAEQLNKFNMDMVDESLKMHELTENRVEVFEYVSVDELDDIATTNGLHQLPFELVHFEHPKLKTSHSYAPIISPNYTMCIPAYVVLEQVFNILSNELKIFYRLRRDSINELTRYIANLCYYLQPESQTTFCLDYKKVGELLDETRRLFNPLMDSSVEDIEDVDESVKPKEFKRILDKYAKNSIFRSFEIMLTICGDRVEHLNKNIPRNHLDECLYESGCRCLMFEYPELAIAYHNQKMCKTIGKTQFCAITLIEDVHFEFDTPHRCAVGHSQFITEYQKKIRENGVTRDHKLVESTSWCRRMMEKKKAEEVVVVEEKEEVEEVESEVETESEKEYEEEFEVNNEVFERLIHNDQMPSSSNGVGRRNKKKKKEKKHEKEAIHLLMGGRRKNNKFTKREDQKMISKLLGTEETEVEEEVIICEVDDVREFCRKLKDNMGPLIANMPFDAISLTDFEDVVKMALMNDISTKDEATMEAIHGRDFFILFGDVMAKDFQTFIKGGVKMIRARNWCAREEDLVEDYEFIDEVEFPAVVNVEVEKPVNEWEMSKFYEAIKGVKKVEEVVEDVKVEEVKVEEKEVVEEIVEELEEVHDYDMEEFEDEETPYIPQPRSEELEELREDYRHIKDYNRLLYAERDDLSFRLDAVQDELRDQKGMYSELEEKYKELQAKLERQNEEAEIVQKKENEEKESQALETANMEIERLREQLQNANQQVLIAQQNLGQFALTTEPLLLKFDSAIDFYTYVVANGDELEANADMMFAQYRDESERHENIAYSDLMQYKSDLMQLKVEAIMNLKVLENNPSPLIASPESLKLPTIFRKKITDIMSIMSPRSFDLSQSF